jgi:hypothetical protein
MDIKNVTSVGHLQSSPKVGKNERKKGTTFNVGGSHLSSSSFVQSTLSTTTVDALFLLLDKNDTPQRKILNRGNLILDYLEKIRLGLVMGEIGYESLSNLNQILQKHIPEEMDSKLQELMREIETRAQVELAKLEKR